MTAPARLVVLPNEPIATINPLLHGQFAEHLGELVYPGVWVGPDSSIPNVNGIRSDVVDALKPLNLSVLRWPGGCFADAYHWRDGIGPRENRPKRINLHWGMAEEPNLFGTHEFMAFCRAIGADPYFAANLGSAPPSETRDWVEYCNFAGDSTLANERRANGDDDPFKIKYWGIGNENWGCGGNMSPRQYAAEFNRYRTFAFDFPGTSLTRIACGPNDAKWDWTRQFFETMKEASYCMGGIGAFAAHYYCGSAGTATEYTEKQWLELLSRAVVVEGVIIGHRSIMDEYDPDRKIGLYLDEWGTWHPADPKKPQGGLYQQNTIRDACIAALSLDIFNQHADKLVMANIAQLVNVLQALLLVEGDKCIKTPTYHVFDLYQPHKGAQSVRMIAESEILSYGEDSAEHCRNMFRDKHFRGLNAVQGSASLKDGKLCVTAVNSHPTDAIEVIIEVRDRKLSSAEVVTLTTDNILALNTFDNPETVKLSAPTIVDATDGSIRLTIPAASVIRVMG